MSSSALLTLIAIIASIEGGQATVEGELLGYLRPGDTGSVQYQITVGNEVRTIAVGTAEVVSVGEADAEVRIATKRQVLPGFGVRFELPLGRMREEGGDPAAEMAAALASVKLKLATALESGTMLSTRVGELEGELASARAERAEAERAAGGKVRTAQDELIATRSELAQAAVEQARFEGELAAAREALELAQQSLEAAKAEAATDQAASTARFSEFEEAAKAKEVELETQLDEARKTGDALTLQLDKERSAKETLEGELATARKAAEGVAAELAGERTLRTEKEASVVAGSQAAEELTRRVSQLEGELAAAGEALELAQQSLEAAKAEAATDQAASTARFSEFEEAAKAKEDERLALAARLEDERKTKESLEAELAAERTLRTEIEASAVAGSQAAEELARRVSELEGELAAAGEALELAQQSLEAAKAEAATDQAASTSRFDEFEEATKAKEDERLALAGKLEDERKMKQSLAAELATARKAAEGAAAELAEERKVRETLEAELAAVELVEAERVAGAASSTTAEDAPIPAVSAGGEPVATPEDGAADAVQRATSEEIEARVRAWAAAWSEQDAGAYLGFYAREYRVPNGMSRAQWEAQRRDRLAAPEFIEIVLEEFEVTSSMAESAEVRFEQSYRSNTFEDRVTKTLGLVFEEGAWKIALEETK